MLPDHALTDITPNVVLTLRLRKDPLIDALLDRIEELEADVEAVSAEWSEAADEVTRLQAQLDQANTEIAALEGQVAAFTEGAVSA